MCLREMDTVSREITLEWKCMPPSSLGQPFIKGMTFLHLTATSLFKISPYC